MITYFFVLILSLLWILIFRAAIIIVLMKETDYFCNDLEQSQTTNKIIVEICKIERVRNVNHSIKKKKKKKKKIIIPIHQISYILLLTLLEYFLNLFWDLQ